MKYVVIYVGIFALLFLIDYLFTYFFFVKKDRIGEQKSYYYIVRRYKLNMDKKKKYTLGKLIVLVNSFTLSIPIFIVIVFDKLAFWLCLLLAGVITIVLLISLYSLVGKMLKKRGW